MPITTLVAPVAHLRGPGKLRFRDGAFLYEPVGGDPARLPPMSLERVVCHGPVEATSPAMDECARRGISLAWLSLGGGRFRMRLEPSQSPTVKIRLRQLAAARDEAWNISRARSLVLRKVESIAEALRHGQRHDAPHAGEALASLAPLLEKTAAGDSVASLRGFEGAATAIWYDYFRTRIPSPWVFPGRVRRPPTDPVNALLGLGSALLRHRAEALSAAAGLETALGSLHAFRPGRPSLACDLMEPFRLQLVDRWVLRLLRQNLLRPGDFQAGETGGVTVAEGAFSHVVARWETDAAESCLAEGLEALVAETIESLPELPSGEREGGETDANDGWDWL